MRNVSTELLARLERSVTNLALCCKITYQNGKILALTTNSDDLVIDGITYKANSGFSTESLRSTSKTNPSNMELSLFANFIPVSDLVSRQIVGAKVEIFLVDYKDPGVGKILLLKGFIGNLTLERGVFRGHVHSLADMLKNYSPVIISHECTASLGDSRCKVNVADYSSSGTITEVLNNFTIKDDNQTANDGWFDYGYITFTSGANAGLTFEVRRFEAKKFILLERLPYLPAVGDEYTAYAGCDKTAETCKSKFNNFINFRGFPFVPLPDEVLWYQDLK